MMSSDYSKRDYLLPKGCKDLIDVINLQKSQKQELKWQAGESFNQLPPITGEILLPEGTSVAEFAALLGQKPFKIVADLMGLGIFANVKQLVDFEAMRKVARKYGYLVKRPS